MKPLKALKKRAMMTMAALNWRERNMDTFISGARAPPRSSRACQATKPAMTSSDSTTSTHTHAVCQPTTLPSVRAKRSANSPTVMRKAPAQATVARAAAAWCRVGFAGGGMMKTPAMAMVPVRMAMVPNTQRHEAYDATKPARRLPNMLPSGAPAPADGLTFFFLALRLGKAVVSPQRQQSGEMREEGRGEKMVVIVPYAANA